MGLTLLKWIVAASLTLALTMSMRLLLNRRGRKDPILLAGSVVSAGFVLGGVVGLILAERGALTSLCLGAMGAVLMTRRWHSQEAVSVSRPGA